MKKLSVWFLTILVLQLVITKSIFAAPKDINQSTPSPTQAPIVTNTPSQSTSVTPTPTDSVIAPTSIPSQTPVSVTPTETITPSSTPSQLTPTVTLQPTSAVLGTSTTSTTPTPTSIPRITTSVTPTLPPPAVSPNVKIATIAAVIKDAPIIKNIIGFPATFFAHALPSNFYAADKLSRPVTISLLIIASVFFLIGIILIWPKALTSLQQKIVQIKEQYKLRKGHKLVGI